MLTLLWRRLKARFGSPVPAESERLLLSAPGKTDDLAMPPDLIPAASETSETSEIPDISAKVPATQAMPAAPIPEALETSIPPTILNIPAAEAGQEVAPETGQQEQQQPDEVKAETETETKTETDAKAEAEAAVPGVGSHGAHETRAHEDPAPDAARGFPFLPVTPAVDTERFNRWCARLKQIDLDLPSDLPALPEAADTSVSRCSEAETETETLQIARDRLALAAGYIRLGEYQAARILIDEVAQSGDIVLREAARQLQASLDT